MAVEDRFWAKVAKDPTSCWMWHERSNNGVGYGIFNAGRGRRVYAHRYSWELFHGMPVPAGKVIRHNCDTPGCVRPDHLIIGTQRDNVYDMLSRGRHGRGGPGYKVGVDNPSSKLLDEDVRAIRACYATGRWGYRSLGRMFLITPIAVKKIVMRITWKHVA